MENIKNWAACMLVVHPETGKILAVSRKNNSEDFGLLGGGVEEIDNFSTFNAAKREAKEEADINVNKAILIYSGKARTRFVDVYLATEWWGEPKTCEEGIVQWVDYEVLLKGTFGSFNKLLLNELMKYIMKNNV